MNIFNKALDKALNIAYNAGSEKVDVVSVKVGYERTPFGACEGDWIKRIQFHDDSIYVVMYFAPKGSSFPRHIHKVFESAIVTKGRVRIKALNVDSIIEEGRVYEVEAGKAHSVEFLEDTILTIQFHPAFEGDWEASDG